MKISYLPLGAYATNCYIAYDEATNRAAVIDPGDQAEDLLKILQDHDLTVGVILLTHGHFDHTGAVDALREKTGAPVYIHRADLDPAICRDALDLNGAFNHYDEGDQVTLDSMTFRVLHTPGHTPGSVCLICQDALFAGDTLFAGSCGRTDLPKGNWDDMEKSLKRLYQLEGDFTVLPGHEGLSTLERERQVNPFMRQALMDLGE